MKYSALQQDNDMVRKYMVTVERQQDAMTCDASTLYLQEWEHQHLQRYQIPHQIEVQGLKCVPSFESKQTSFWNLDLYIPGMGYIRFAAGLIAKQCL